MEIAGQDAELPEIRRRARFFAFVMLACSWRSRGACSTCRSSRATAFYRLTSDNIIRTDAAAGRARADPRSQEPRARDGAALVQPLRLAAAADQRGASRKPARGAGHERATRRWSVWERVQRRRGGRRARGARNERPVLLAEDISREAMAAIETGARHPGREDRLGAAPRVPVRRRSASHVLGYMNEISADELRAKKDEGYRPGDLGRAHRHRAPVGGLPARARRGSRRSSSTGAACPSPNIREIIDGPVKQARRARQPPRSHARRRRAAHRRARAARRRGGGGRRAGRRHGPRARRWYRSPASIPTRCRATSRPRPSSAS